eukprot:gene12197-biopygen4751
MELGTRSGVPAHLRGAAADGGTAARSLAPFRADARPHGRRWGSRGASQRPSSPATRRSGGAGDGERGDPGPRASGQGCQVLHGRWRTAGGLGGLPAWLADLADLADWLGGIGGLRLADLADLADGLAVTSRRGHVRRSEVGETMSRRSVCGLPWRTLVRRLADLADYVRSAGGLGGLGQVGLADLADSYWPTWRTWRTRKADLADLADWVGGLGGLGAMMAEDSRTQKTGEDEDSWEQRLQLRSRSTAFCVRDPTFCVQIPAFCVQLRSRSAGFRILRSAVFCVQLRSAFRILRSAFR